MTENAPGGFAAPTLQDIRKQLGTLEVAERFFESAVLFALHELGVFPLLAGRHLVRFHKNYLQQFPPDHIGLSNHQRR